MKTTPIDNSSRNQHAFQIKGDASFLGSSGKVHKPGAFESEMSSALGALSQLDNSDQLRADAIKNGKAIVENWKDPSDNQIDAILGKMNGLI